MSQRRERAMSRPLDIGACLRKAVSAAVVAALAIGVVETGAQAQDSNAAPGYEPAPKRTTQRRNDAFRPTETGPGLGTLTGPAPQTGGTPDPTYSPANRVGAYPADSTPPPQGGYAQGGYSQGTGQADQGGYVPRYGEPVRPYAPGADAGAPPSTYAQTSPYPPQPQPQARDDVYRPPQGGYGQGAPSGPSGAYGQGGSRPDAYGSGAYANQGGYGSQPPPPPPQSGYGQPYAPPPDANRGYASDDYGPGPQDRRPARDGTYSSNEILGAGHKFFGSVSQGLAKVVESAFQRQGRPNGYILGEEAGGAFIAGLRYGEGVLYTRDAGSHKVFWQGPSLGYDVGGAGSKTMILVYNLRSPDEIYERFGGVDGSAYFVGGVGMTVLTRDHITLAPIRTGVGLRLGANVGYLKFTPQATWNPF